VKTDESAPTCYKHVEEDLLAMGVPAGPVIHVFILSLFNSSPILRRSLLIYFSVMFILRIHFRVMSMRILADSLPCDVVLCGEHEESPCVQRLIRLRGIAVVE